MQGSGALLALLLGLQWSAAAFTLGIDIVFATSGDASRVGL
jgi:hypothetical protein